VAGRAVLADPGGRVEPDPGVQALPVGQLSDPPPSKPSSYARRWFAASHRELR
jgi:hypothetical protein